MTNIIEVENLSFSYGSTPCLENIDLNVKAGDFIALVGPNGAGKSTLLACIAGDHKISSGTVKLQGKALHEYSTRQLANVRSVMEQSTHVYFEYLVHDVVAMGRNNSQSLKDDELGFIDQCLEKADVKELEFRKVSALSGGERSRVALARVLAQDCPIVLLDEPTASLDIQHQESTMRIARELTRSGVAVIVVLHDLNLAAAYCNKVVLMQKGKIVEQGDFETVFRPEVLSAVYKCPIYVAKADNGIRVEPVRTHEQDTTTAMQNLLQQCPVMRNTNCSNC